MKSILTNLDKNQWMTIKNPTFGQQMEFRIPHYICINNAALWVAVCTVEIQSPWNGAKCMLPHLPITS